MAQNYISSGLSFNGSSVNYFDIPMEYGAAGSNMGDIMPNATWYIWANPSSTRNFRFQILNSSATVQNFDWQGVYGYVSTNTARYASNANYFYASYDTASLTYGSGVKMNIGWMGGDTTYRSLFYKLGTRSNTTWTSYERGVITPIAGSATDWVTLRCYFDNTSSANVSSYRVYSGI